MTKNLKSQKSTEDIDTSKDMGFYKSVDTALKDKQYMAEYSYLVMMYGDLFKNILRALFLRRNEPKKIPQRYEKDNDEVIAFYRRWHGSIKK